MRNHRTVLIPMTGALAVWLGGCHTTEPAVATHLGFENGPLPSAASTQSLGPITVTALTSAGHVASGASGGVEISLISSNTNAHLSGTLVAQISGGRASFTDLTVDKASVAYRLVAKAAGLDSAVSQPFSITPGPAVALRFDSSIPSQQQVGSQIQPPVSVSVTDAAGNLASAATPAISLSSTAGSLNGTTTVTATSGTAVFSPLFPTQAGDQSLVATAPGLASATSNSFSVRPAPGPCTFLRFFSPPADAKAGSPIPGFVVSCVDSNGYGVPLPPGGSMTVTVSLGTNPTGATLSGQTTVGGVRAGVYFSNVIIDKPGVGYTLIASADGYTSATSGPFNVMP